MFRVAERNNLIANAFGKIEQLYMLLNENALFDQFYAISEHVSRAKTDLYLNALLAFSFGIEKLLME